MVQPNDDIAGPVGDYPGGSLGDVDLVVSGCALILGLLDLVTRRECTAQTRASLRALLGRHC